jgi:hypothetical protein
MRTDDVLLRDPARKSAGAATGGPHPILNRTTAGIHAIADTFADRILARLSGTAV